MPVQRLDLVARLDRPAAHEHAAAVDRRLDAVARAVLHPQREEFVEPHRLLPPVDVDREVLVELVSLLHLAAVGLGLAPQRLLVVGRSAAVRLSAALRGPQLRIAVSFLRSVHRLKEIILLGVRRPGAALQLLGMAAHLGLGQRIGEFGPPALPLLAQRLRLLGPKRRFRVPPSPRRASGAAPLRNPLPSHIPARAAGRRHVHPSGSAGRSPRRRRPLLR